MENSPHSQSELLRKLERYELAFRGSTDGLWDWDLKSDQIHFSPQWKSMIGCTGADIADSPAEWFNRVHDKDVEVLKKALQEHLEGKSLRFENEYRIIHKNYSYRWMLARGTAVRDASGKALRIAGSQVDITDRKNAEFHLNQALEDLKLALASEKVLLEELDKKNKELTELSITDGLTRLYNHRYLQERFDFEFKRAKRYDTPLSCIVLDIDHFKNVNDTYGHPFGDEVLQGIGELIKAQSREVDICGRYGGEEFLIITNLVIEDTVQFAIRLNRLVEQRLFTVNGATFHTTISAGVAAMTEEVKNKQELFEHADKALYLAKRSGRNRVMEWSEIAENDETSIESFSVEDLRQRFTDLSNEMRATYMESTAALVNAIDAKDHYTREHSQNVARYAEQVAEAMKLSEKNREIIRNAALLHDIGKIGMPYEILTKESRLTNEEYEIIKKHPLIGVNILRDVKFLEKEIPLVLHHHERWDGTGYPHGLKSREIPFGARILTVVDAYDAMTTDRKYRPKLSQEDALEELKRHKGTQFDGEIVDLFSKVMKEEIKERSCIPK